MTMVGMNCLTSYVRSRPGRDGVVGGLFVVLIATGILLIRPTDFESALVSAQLYLSSSFQDFLY